MQSLLGDRFLKRFAGAIRRKEKHPDLETEEQTLDAGEKNVLSTDKNAAEETHEKGATDGQENRKDSTPKLYEAPSE